VFRGKDEAANGALLLQCRIALLQCSDEQLDILLKSWFESMIGEESMDETLDDLCLLLNYRVRTWGTQTSYGTYTAWWEVEGSLLVEEGEGSGEFFCANVAALRQKLLGLSIKQFDLVVGVAYQVLSLDDQRPPLPVGQTFLYVFAHWLSDVTRAFSDVQDQCGPYKTKAEGKKQRREQNKQMIAQARQRGYVVVHPDSVSVVKDAFRHWCKEECRPYICVEMLTAQLARVFVDLKTLGTWLEMMAAPRIQPRLDTLAASYLSRSRAQQYQPRLRWASQHVVILEEVLAEDAELAALSLEILPTNVPQPFLPQP
jgi:hypothetical protein